MEPLSTQDENAILQLDWHDEEGHVTVTPRNQDRYVLKVRAAIERLRLGSDVQHVEDQMKVLRNELAQWLKGREEIRNAYLTTRDGGFLFVVVTESSAYDEAFEDELTELDIRLAKDVDLEPLPIDVLSLPNASDPALDMFLDKSIILSY